MGKHEPVRPAWRCAGCDLEWPCPEAQQHMSSEYRGARITLGLYLTAYMFDAMRDLRHLPAGQVYERFLGWIRDDDAP